MSRHGDTFSQMRNRLLPLALVLVGALGAVWVLYVILSASFNASPSVGAQKVPQGLERLKFARSPIPVPRAPFQDENGKTLRLADKTGRVLLVNLWATWCAPCVEEMPALDRLQGALGGDNFEVIALNLDRGGMDVARSFYVENGIEHLALYNATTMAITRELLMDGLPISLLVGRGGLEIARLSGPAKWDSPAIKNFIQGHIDRR